MPLAPHRRVQRPFQAIAYASPLKTARRGSSRPAKRQKIDISPPKAPSEVSQSSSYGDENDPIILSDSASDSEDRVRPLESDHGTAMLNRGKANRSKDVKGKGVELRLKKQKSRNFAQHAVSPRKRKRDVWDEQGADVDVEAHPDDDDDFESYDGSSSVRSLQDDAIDDAELEPVFMKDGGLYSGDSLVSCLRLDLQMTISCFIKHRAISSIACERQNSFAFGKLLESGKETRRVSRVRVWQMSRRTIVNLS